MFTSFALALVLFFQTPFWEAKAPKYWSEEELASIFENSPWAEQSTGSGGRGLVVYLASAKPMRDAELEYRRRHPPKRVAGEEDPSPYAEYADFLAENEDKVIVLAMRADPAAFAHADEVKTMEDECELRLKGRKLHLTGHFPPTISDPFLRLVFPRMLSPEDTQLQFMLYIPGVRDRYREAFFKLKDLMYKGKAEF